MSPSLNRGRITVDVGGKWQIYTNALPAHSQAIGLVTRNECETGALVFLKATGLYVMVNAGALRSLPQPKVLAALAQTPEADQCERLNFWTCFVPGQGWVQCSRTDNGAQPDINRLRGYLAGVND